MLNLLYKYKDAALTVAVIGLIILSAVVCGK